MAQIATPDGSRFNNWGTSGCAVARPDQCIDEGIGGDDGNFLFETVVSTNFAVDLDSGITDPATHWGHIIKVRMGDIGGGVGTFGVTIQFRQGLTIIETFTETTLAPGYVTYEFELAEANAANITDYTDLEVWVGLTTSSISSGSPEARIENMEMEAPDVGQMQAGAVTGQATVANATLLGAGALEGTVTGQATVANADLLGAGDLQAGAITGQATVANADLAGAGALVTPGVTGQATVANADLLGSGRLIGTAPGQATVANAILLGAGRLIGTARGQAYTFGNWRPPPNPFKVVTAFDALLPFPLWTRIMVPQGLMVRLTVENNTDVRIEGSFTTPTVAEFYLEAGEDQVWDLVCSPIDGGVYARGSTAAPASGDVIAEAIFQ